MSGQPVPVRVAAALAIAFGVLTVMSGGSTLAGLVALEAVVPFVLWFNFLAGFAYVAGGVALWSGSRLALPLALAILAATLAVFALLGLRIAAGGSYAPRSLAAMTLRTGFWAAIAWTAWKAGPTREAL